MSKKVSEYSTIFDILHIMKGDKSFFLKNVFYKENKKRN